MKSVSIIWYSWLNLPRRWGGAISLHHKSNQLLLKHGQNFVSSSSSSSSSETSRSVTMRAWLWWRAYEAAHDDTHKVTNFSLNAAMSLNMHGVSLHHTMPVLQSCDYCNLLPDTASYTYNMHACIHASIFHATNWYVKHAYTTQAWHHLSLGSYSIMQCWSRITNWDTCDVQIWFQSWESLPVIDGDRDRGKGDLYPHNRLSQSLTVHAAAAFVIHDWVQECYSTHALNMTKKTCGLGVQSAAQRHNVHNTHTWQTAMLVAWQIVLS